MPKLKLHSACLATSEDDLNWQTWLVIAHEDEKKMRGLVIDKLINDFYSQWELNGKEGRELDEQDPDEYERRRFEDFLNYAHKNGYTVLKPGNLHWFVEPLQ